MDSPPKRKLWIPQGIIASRFQEPSISIEGEEKILELKNELAGCRSDKEKKKIAREIRAIEAEELMLIISDRLPANVVRHPIDVTHRFLLRSITPPEEGVYIAGEIEGIVEQNSPTVSVTSKNSVLTADGFDEVAELTVFRNFDLLARLSTLMLDAWSVFGISCEKTSDNQNLKPYHRFQEAWKDPNLNLKNPSISDRLKKTCEATQKTFELRERDILRRSDVKMPQVISELQRELVYSTEFSNAIVLASVAGLKSRPDNQEILSIALSIAVVKICRESPKWLAECYKPEANDRNYFGKVENNVRPATRKEVTGIVNPFLPRDLADTFLFLSESQSLSEARQKAIRLEKKRATSTKLSKSESQLLNAGRSYKTHKKAYAKHHFFRVTDWHSNNGTTVNEKSVYLFLETIDKCSLLERTDEFQIDIPLRAALEGNLQDIPIDFDEWDQEIAEQLIVKPSDKTVEKSLDIDEYTNSKEAASQNIEDKRQKSASDLRIALMDVANWMRQNGFEDTDIQTALTVHEILVPGDSGYIEVLSEFDLPTNLPQMPFDEEGEAWKTLKKRISDRKKLNEENQ